MNVNEIEFRRTPDDAQSTIPLARLALLALAFAGLQEQEMVEVVLDIAGIGPVPMVLHARFAASKRILELARGGGKGHVHRAEPQPPNGSNGPPYALVQFSLESDAGLNTLPHEGDEKIARGAVCLIGGANDLFISLARGAEHAGWEASMTVLGHVPQPALDELIEGAILAKPKHTFTHPQYGTVMSMLDTKLPLTLRATAP